MIELSTTHQRVDIATLAVVTVVVEDVDEPLEFYTGSIGFEVRTDEEFEMTGETGRWVAVGVTGDPVELAIAAADEPDYDGETREHVAAKLGSQTRSAFRTPGCSAGVTAPEARGVEITRRLQAKP